MQLDVEDNIAKYSTCRGELEIPVTRLPFLSVTLWPTLFAKVSKERLKSNANNDSGVNQGTPKIFKQQLMSSL